MTYTALAVAFMLVCVGLGARVGAASARPRVALIVAMAMVAAQFAVLLSSR